ncbi:MAG: L,D-transpeptidase family protein [Tatlockia sp.]|jgi:L,D-transpeptidase ErfK/SrfK
MAIDLKRNSVSKVLLLLLLVKCSFANTYVLPMRGALIGSLQYGYAQPGETLADVGNRYDLGLTEMRRANPGINASAVLPTETRLMLPTQFRLPPAPHKGIVINLAEFRLYYFPPDDNVVITMPVGIGREGFNTPLGLTKVISKERDPVWHPTPKIRREAKKKGMMLPHAFPGGEGNPLGRHVLRLGWPTYLIHGTNRRDGIGQRVSAGCIRMLPEDIDYLFDLVAVNTPVRVINAPINPMRKA